MLLSGVMFCNFSQTPRLHLPNFRIIYTPEVSWFFMNAIGKAHVLRRLQLDMIGAASGVLKQSDALGPKPAWAQTRCGLFSGRAESARTATRIRHWLGRAMR